MTAATLAGVHTTEHAAGALENGTRVRKTVMREGDAHGIGARATVVGSVDVEDLRLRARFFYFVEWDEHPGIAVGVAGDAIAALE